MTLCLGDRRVRLRFAGPALADALTDALRPRLAANAGPVHATIGLWEESRSPGGASPVPWRDVDLGARGLLRGPDGARVIAVHEAGSGALTLVDRPARAAPLPRARRLDPALVGAGRAAATGALLGAERAGTPPGSRGSRGG